MPYDPFEIRTYPKRRKNQPGLGSDIGHGFTAAANTGLAGMARAVDTVFGDGQDGEIINQLEQNAEYNREQLSQAQQEANQKKFFNDDLTPGRAWLDPRAYTGTVAEAAGSMVPMLAGGGLLSGALKKGVTMAGAKGLANLAGASGYGLAESAMVTGGVSGDIQKAIQDMPDDIVATSPRFQEVFYQGLEAGKSEDAAFSEARDTLARETAVQGMKDVALPSYLLGTVAGRFLDEAIGGKLTGGRLKSAGVGALTEGSTEGAQEAAEQYIQQSKLAEIDPSIDPTQGIADAVARGVIGGGVVGGGLGGIANQAKQNSDRNAQKFREGLGYTDTKYADVRRPTWTEPTYAKYYNTNEISQEVSDKGSKPVQDETQLTKEPTQEQVEQNKLDLQASLVTANADNYNQYMLQLADQLGAKGEAILERGAIQDRSNKEIITQLEGALNEQKRTQEDAGTERGIEAGKNSKGLSKLAQERTGEGGAIGQASEEVSNETNTKKAARKNSAFNVNVEQSNIPDDERTTNTLLGGQREQIGKADKSETTKKTKKFSPTHLTSDNEPVRATEEPNVYVNEQGEEIEDEYATELRDKTLSNEPQPAPRQTLGLQETTNKEINDRSTSKRTDATPSTTPSNAAAGRGIGAGIAADERQQSNNVQVEGTVRRNEAGGIRDVAGTTEQQVNEQTNFSKQSTFQGNKTVTAKRKYGEDEDGYSLKSEVSIIKQKGESDFQVATPNGLVLKSGIKSMREAKSFVDKALDRVQVIDGRPFIVAPNGEVALARKAYGSITGGTATELEAAAKQTLSEKKQEAISEQTSKTKSKQKNAYDIVIDEQNNKDRQIVKEYLNYESEQNKRRAFSDKHNIPYAQSLINNDFEKAVDDIKRNYVTKEKAREIFNDAKDTGLLNISTINKIENTLNEQTSKTTPKKAKAQAAKIPHLKPNEAEEVLTYGKDKLVPNFIKGRFQVTPQQANEIIARVNEVNTRTSKKATGRVLAKDSQGRQNVSDTKAKKQAQKLRNVAQRMIDKAQEEQDRDRQTNTSRRANMAGNAIQRAMADEALAKSMMNIADAIEAGKAKSLSKVTNKIQVELLDNIADNAITDRDNKRFSYAEGQKYKGRVFENDDLDFVRFPTTNLETGGSYSRLITALAKVRGGKTLAKQVSPGMQVSNEFLKKIEGLLGKKDTEYAFDWYLVDNIKKKERLRKLGIENQQQLRQAISDYVKFKKGVKQENEATKLERELVGKKGIGIDFFPTPKSLAERMVDEAGIKSGMKVLEPSAGNGNIADAMKAKGADVDVIELSSELRKILKAKKHNIVEHDFMAYEPQYQYDAIIMNPPFSNSLDAQHVKHAYTMLKPGGTLFAITGEGVHFRGDKKATEFRNWLEDVDAEVEKLPAKTFLDKNLPATTGVNARLVKIEKPKNAQQESQINSEILSSFNSAKDAVLWIKNNASNHVYREIANSIQNLVPDDIGFKFKKNESNLAKGRYHKREKQDGTVIYNHILIYENGANEETVTHELIHVATHETISDPKTQEQKESIKELQNLLDEFYPLAITSDKLTQDEKDRVRAARNVDEFITYSLTSKKFQNALSKIKQKNIKQSFLTSLGKIIKRLLGLNVNDSTYLSRAIFSSSRLIDSIESEVGGKWNKLDNKERYNFIRGYVNKDIARELSRKEWFNLNTNEKEIVERNYVYAKSLIDGLTSGVVDIDKFPLKRVESSFSGTSMHPGDAALIQRNSFIEFIQSEYEKAKPFTETKEQESVLNTTIKNLQDEWIEKLIPVLSERSSTVSSHIAGRSKFNRKQASRRNSSLDKSNDNFQSWVNKVTGSVKKAVLDARNQKQIDAEQAEKDAKAKEKQAKLESMIESYLNFKKGDDTKFGIYSIKKVTKDRDGYPSSVIVDATDLTDNKFNIAKTLFNGDKTKLQAIVDKIRNEKIKGKQNAKFSINVEEDVLSDSEWKSYFGGEGRTFGAETKTDTGRQATERSARDEESRTFKRLTGLEPSNAFTKDGKIVSLIHRSKESFTNFDDNKRGSNTARPFARLGHFATTTDDLSSYGDHKNEYYFVAKSNEVLTLTADEMEMYGSFSAEQIDGIRDGLIKSGIKVVEIPAADTYIVLEGKNAFPKSVDGVAKFSKGKSTGTTVDQVKTLITNKYRKAKKMLNDGSLVVVQSVEDLPASLRQQGNALFHAAWHGTPHDFDKFSLEHIGKGEGAQAYGYGLYFADAKEIAEWYRDSLARPISIIKETVKNEHPQISDDAARIILEFTNRVRNGELSFGEATRKIGYANRELRNIDDNVLRSMVEKASNAQLRGKLYQVELAPQQDEYLLWDKPLSEQSENVKDAIFNSKYKIKFSDDATKYGFTKLSNKISGKDFYKLVQNDELQGQKGASDFLHSLGIRGIKYLDGTSRSKGEGAYNYVLFSDEDVSITAKYSKLANIEGLYANGKTYLVADMLNAGNIEPVFLHEMLHKSLAENPNLKQRLENNIGGLRDIFEQTKSGKYKGRYKTIYDAALKRVEKANTPEADEFEEFLAYAVSLAQTKPQSIPARLKQTISDLVSTIRAALYRAGVTVKLNPNDLSALARQAIGQRIDTSNANVLKSAKESGNMVNTSNGSFLTDEVKNDIEKAYDDGIYTFGIRAMNSSPDGKAIKIKKGEYVDNSYMNVDDEAQFEIGGTSSMGIDVDFGEVDSEENFNDVIKRVAKEYGNNDTYIVVIGGTHNLDEIHNDVDETIISDAKIVSIIGTTNQINESSEQTNAKYSIASTAWEGLKESETTEYVKNRLGRASSTAKAQSFGLLTLRQIADVTKKVLPEIKRTFITAIHDMDTEKNKRLSAAGEIATDWSSLPKKISMELSDLMHDSTIAGVDGSKPYVPVIDYKEANQRIKSIRQQMRDRSGEDKSRMLREIAELKMKMAFEKKRKLAYPELKARFNKLARKSPEAARIYHAARDYHEQHFSDTMEALTDRITQSKASPVVKKSLMSQLRQKFESLQAEAPYFPLARFGDYWVHTSTGDETMFNMFESEKEQKAFIEQMEKEGMVVLGSGKQLENLSEIDGVSAEFITEVDSLISQLGDVPMVNDLRDSVYQLYLNTLPDVSARKHFIHRKKTKGFHNDQLRAFAYKALHDANNISKLMYGYKLQAVLDQSKDVLDIASSSVKAESVQQDIEQMQEFLRLDPSLTEIKRRLRETEDEHEHEMYLRFRKWRENYNKEEIKTLVEHNERLMELSKNIKPDDKVFAANALNELRKSYKDLMNPKLNPISQMLNSLGFAYYLGLTPAAAIVNVTQTPVVALPLLASKVGWGTASKMMGQATKLFFDGMKAGKKNGMPWVEGLSIEGKLKGNELKAYQAWVDSGLIDVTLAHDLAGLSDEGVLTNTFKHKLMNVLSFGFHHAERMNREITALAAYRAARIPKSQGGQGMTHSQAVQFAEDIVWDSHFNYASSNRARFMRGNVARVVTQFKQYSQNLTYLYGRTFQQAFSENATPQEQAEARRALRGLLTMQFAAAGTLGLPVVSVMMETAQVLKDIFGDDDEPEDIKGLYRQALADVVTNITGSEDVGNRFGLIMSKGFVDGLTPYSVSGRLSASDLWVRESNRELEGTDQAWQWAKTILGPMAGLLLENPAIALNMAQDGHYERAVEYMMPKAVKDTMKALRYSMDGVENLRGDKLVDDYSIVEGVGQLLGFASSQINEIYDQNNAIKRLEHKLNDRRQRLLTKAARAKMEGNMSDYLDAQKEIRGFNTKNPGQRITSANIRQSIKGMKRRTSETRQGLYMTKRNRGLADRYRFAD